MGQMQVITGVERRRRWSEVQKRAIVAEAFAPGAIVSDVARRADVCGNQIYRWRQELRSKATGFAEVVVSGPMPSIESANGEAIEVFIDDGARVRIPRSISPDLAAAVVSALLRR